MPDFKMTMKTSKPSFQRIAVARALRNIAPQAYMSATKNRDMVPFVQQVQKRWRFFTSKLKEEGYEPFDSKKFGYARNCVPVLVSATARPDYGGRLVPCSIPLCPFCWSRSVVIRAAELLEPHKNRIDEWYWGKITYEVNYTGADNLFDWVNDAFGELNEHNYEGLIGYAYIWSDNSLSKETPKYYGTLRYLGVAPEHSAEPPKYTRAKDAPKAIGEAFEYPHHLLPSAKDSTVVSQSAPFWNALRTRRHRALRTKGIFFKAPKLRKPKQTKEEKFNEIYRRLERLEKKLFGETPSGENIDE